MYKWQKHNRKFDNTHNKYNNVIGMKIIFEKPTNKETEIFQTLLIKKCLFACALIVLVFHFTSKIKHLFMKLLSN